MVAVAWRWRRGWYGEGGGGGTETTTGVVRRERRQRHRDSDGGGTERAVAAARRLVAQFPPLTLSEREWAGTADTLFAPKPAYPIVEKWSPWNAFDPDSDEFFNSESAVYEAFLTDEEIAAHVQE